MNQKIISVGVLKTGNIGASTVLELSLDERAERGDIKVKVISSGSKMDENTAREVADIFLKTLSPDLIIYSTPNAAATGPRTVLELLKDRTEEVIIISDGAAAKIKRELEDAGFGYVFVKADAMIGARREFLDATEMAVFNGDILKVLACTGVVRALHTEIDKAIDALKKGERYLPRVIIDRNTAMRHANFSNPYAVAKASAAFEIAEKAGELAVQGCFIEKAEEEYILTVAAAHELIREAAKLADEAREIEKKGDAVYRTPHYKDGTLLKKRKLMEKPK
jgi:methylenetetrahydromethanopterin dehydrogenase